METAKTLNLITAGQLGTCPKCHQDDDDDDDYIGRAQFDNAIPYEDEEPLMPIGMDFNQNRKVADENGNLFPQDKMKPVANSDEGDDGTGGCDCRDDDESPMMALGFKFS
jgi:hypothetical protein